MLRRPFPMVITGKLLLVPFVLLASQRRVGGYFGGGEGPQEAEISKTKTCATLPFRLYVPATFSEVLKGAGDVAPFLDAVVKKHIKPRMGKNIPEHRREPVKR